MTALITTLNMAPIFPVTIETNPKTIPIQDSTTVSLQAHPFPFNNPKAITKYAKPNVKRAAPVTADNPANMLVLFVPVPDRNGATVTAVIPLERNAMPPIIVSIAIIVTPNGLCFCCCSMLIY